MFTAMRRRSLEVACCDVGEGHPRHGADSDVVIGE
jgi:hypothetical protein